jgi:hypothetical protein
MSANLWESDTIFRIFISVLMFLFDWPTYVLTNIETGSVAVAKAASLINKHLQIEVPGRSGSSCVKAVTPSGQQMLMSKVSMLALRFGTGFMGST